MTETLNLRNTARALALRDLHLPIAEAWTEWEALDASTPLDNSLKSRFVTLQFQMLRDWESAWDEYVSRAFYEDTKDRNSLENCLLVKPGPPTPPLGETDVSWLRQQVRKWIAASGKMTTERAAEIAAYVRWKDGFAAACKVPKPANGPNRNEDAQIMAFWDTLSGNTSYYDAVLRMTRGEHFLK